MEISDVRVRLLTDTNDRLKAVCSVTLGENFVIRDIKLVDGTGGLFVAMPSRKLSAPCPKCRTQNHLRARYCNECGSQVPAARIPKDDNGREKAHRDVAHPITATFRQAIQDRVLEAYEEELGSDRPAATESRDNREAEARTPAPERRPEPVEEKEEKEEKSDNSNDYNSMIADLDPGRGRGRRRDSHGPSSDQKPDRNDNRGNDRGRDRQRNTERSDTRRTEPAEKTAPPAPRPKSPPPPKREPAPVAPAASKSDGNTDSGDTAFGMGLDEISPPPAKREAPRAREKTPAPVKPVPQVEESGCDDSGFGAGIL